MAGKQAYGLVGVFFSLQALMMPSADIHTTSFCGFLARLRLVTSISLSMVDAILFTISSDFEDVVHVCHIVRPYCIARFGIAKFSRNADAIAGGAYASCYQVIECILFD